jgi:GTPase SAR1 family protein
VRDSALPTSFRGIRQVLFGLAADLSHLEQTARALGQPALAAQAAELRERVEERRFTVAVLGEFKRGKSTFINALLGDQVLPSDIAPTTATINRVIYGLRPCATLYFKDDRPPQDVPITELRGSITKLTEQAEQQAAQVREAVVAWPLRFCRNDVDLLDTPGLSDEAAMSAITRQILPQVDVALFVILATSPLSESEGTFLREALAHNPARVVFVVTAMDSVRRERDRARVLDAITQRIQGHLELAAKAHAPDPDAQQAWLEQQGPPQVFGVSGLDALEARQEDDPERLAASGVPAFEAHLDELLNRADGVGLQRRLAHTLTLCADLQSALPTATAPAPTLDHAALGPLLRSLSAALTQGIAAWRAQARTLSLDAPQAVAELQQQWTRHTQQTVTALRQDAVRARISGQLESWSSAQATDLWRHLFQLGVDALIPRMNRVVEGWTPGLLELERLALATDYVLDAVAQVMEQAQVAVPAAGSSLVSALASTGGALHARPGPQKMGVHGAVTQLLPSSAELTQALLRPDVAASLQEQANADLFAQFSRALGTTGPAKQWNRAAGAALGQALDDHAQAGPAASIYRDWLEQASMWVAQPLDQGLERVRAMEAALESHRQRDAVLAERAQADAASRRHEVQAIADRVTTLSTELAEMLRG